VGYLPINGKLYELDGLRSGPILIHDDGEVTQENWLEAARKAIQARLTQYAAKEIRFNLMALIGNQSEQLKKKLDDLTREIALAGGPAAAAAANPDPARVILLQDELAHTQKQLAEESIKMERWRVSARPAHRGSEW
jgi:ubiquitin carboxyl-terminal hydrolase L5